MLSLSEKVKQFVIFRLADETFGLPLENVVEVIRKENITDVPKALAFVEGVIHLRNRVIPVIDLKKRFNIAEIEREKNSEEDVNSALEKIIITLINKRYVGLIVDEVYKVISLDPSNIETPAMGKKTDRAYVKGIAKIDDQLIVLIDSSKLLTLEEQSQIETI